MKKIISKLPGGDTKLTNLVAALFLVKEYYVSKDRTTSLMEQRLAHVLEEVNKGVVFVEEEIELSRFLTLQEEGEGGAPTNNTSGAAVDQPKIDKKNIKKYQQMNRRTVVA
jgi:hypothetical protein